jgi:hypothetical protein
MNKLLLLLVLMPSAFAHKIEVSHIETFPDYDINFKLNGKYNKFYGQLDCQSFFKKFDFFDQTNQVLAENYITMSECEYIYSNIAQCITTTNVKCIDSDNIFNTSCDCDN